MDLNEELQQDEVAAAGKAAEIEAIKAAEAADKEKATTPQWAQKRFAEYAKLTNNQKQEIARLAQENAALKATVKAPPGTTPAPTPQVSNEQITEFVRTEAARLAAEETFTKSCNEIFEEGKKEFPEDWKEALGQFANLNGLPTHFVEAASEVGDAHKILYHLSKDLDEAQRYFEMKPVKLAVELERLNRKLNARKSPSRAPAPVEHIEGSGNSSGATKDPEKMSKDEWFAWREADLKARGKRI